MSPLITSLLLPTIGEIVKQVIRSPANAAPAVEAPEIAAEVVRKVEASPAIRDVAARVEHATNAEPWFLSRVTWGAIVAILGGLTTEATLIMNRDASIETHLTALMSIAGGVTTLYGRWVAKKPLGA